VNHFVGGIMTQRELNRAVARATGESLHTIAHFGFSVVPARCAAVDSELTEQAPQMVDWDQVEADRIALAIQA
jgi:hypothetical protein